MKEKIVKLSEREHILRRPSMYVGSIKKEESQEYIYTDGKFTKQSVLRTPGLLKIINEIIDNSVDEFIKTEGKFSTKIDVILEKEFFSVKDNGRGIPVESTILPDGSEILTPELCWTQNILLIKKSSKYYFIEFYMLLFTILLSMVANLCL